MSKNERKKLIRVEMKEKIKEMYNDVRKKKFVSFKCFRKKRRN